MTKKYVLSAFALGLAVVLCGTLGLLTVFGKGGNILNPGNNWASPTKYSEQADNPLVPRNRTRLIPDQFNAITAPKKLAGTPIANIVVRPDRVDIQSGDRVVFSGAFRALPGFDGRVSLADVANLVARSPNPSLLRQTSTGVFQLAAGLVQSPGSRMEVVAPEVTEVRMVSQPYVYMSGVGASVLFKDVKVHSWVPSANEPDTNPSNKRPFLSYDDGGRLDITGSEISYLGQDSSKAYGVSWGGGTTGQADHTTFHHNLFGAYTGGAVGVAFKNNVFRDNSRYGLDPHTDSAGLVVTDNEAYGNNTHGIIFSKSVNHSLVSGNRSHDNGSNGIMMDEKCDFNTIKNNQTWGNRGDGIVLQGSSHNVVEANAVTGNQVGVRVNANNLGPADSNRVRDNQIDGNKLGIQVYGGARDTVTQTNKVTKSGDQAVQFADPATSQSDTITDAHKAIVVRSVGSVIQGLKTSDVGRGVVIAEGASASVDSSQITGEDIAIEVRPEGHIDLAGTDGGTLATVSQARKGILVSGTADLRDISIQGVQRGVLVDSDGRATITSTKIVTSSKGVEVLGFNGRGRVQLVSSDVSAPDPLVGSTLWKESGNELSAIPSWLAVAGAFFVLLATLLHIGHRVLAPMSQVRHKSMPQDA
ncbi:MAG TPA: right-handed parallel beta-helix repeat-containing protein [Pseudonocardia sp.]|nr:right-handed parallel beta-helix repeat-containing protein [Pseudonocardia sp.]